MGLSTILGDSLLGWLHRYEEHALLVLVAVIVTVLFAVHLGMALATHRGRRLLAGKWKRRLRWEFWPSSIIYLPVAFYIVWLMLKHRSLTVFTAANPGIPHGGIALESKRDILGSLDPRYVARFKAIPRDESDKLAVIEDFGYPLVLKPDTGERGQGVGIIHDRASVARYLEECPTDVIVQKFVPGEELGILYERHPEQERGRITSITRKLMAAVTGDGERTLEYLILDDPRAVCSAKFFFKKHAARLDDVPAAGEMVALSELGTHARGALFLDGAEMLTPELEREIDAISKSFPGFHLGRYDLRMDGDDLKVIELNGITSEPAHIYDPKHGYGYAVRALCRHWRKAFEFGVANRKLGARTASLGSLLKLLYQLLNRQKWEAPAVHG